MVRELKSHKLGYLLLVFVAVFVSLGSCDSNPIQEKRLRKAAAGMDLPTILKNGKLRVLVENSSVSYFVYRGKKMGFEYEMLQAFAQELGVELELIPAENLDDIQRILNRGEADLIACNYTITNDRKKEIDFTVPFLYTKQVLVQRKPMSWEKMTDAEVQKVLLTDASQLAKKKIHVWDKSSYYQRLMHLQDEIGDTIYIQNEPGDVTAEDLIEKVAEGYIDYTIVEKNVAQVNTKFHDNLDVNLEISFNQKIGFGLRKTSPLLKARINEWISKFTQTASFKYMKYKYFDLSKITINTQDEFSSLGGGQLSKYDAIFKKEASKYGWDWRFIASVAYQESKFNPDVVSFGGAYGMMQFMPGTGPKYGVYPNSTPAVQIAGGMKKLQSDFKTWHDIPQTDQRQKFTLATYNAGLGHIKDAQRLAEKHGLNPKIWDGNVEEMVKKLSQKEFYRDDVVKFGAMRGTHTAKYVKSIYTRYEGYKSSFR